MNTTFAPPPPTSPSPYTFGDGRISGALSILCGMLSLGGVLCFHFPSLLTTPRLVEIFGVTTLRWMLLVVMILAFLFGLINFIINKARGMGFIGMGATLIASMLGGAWAQSTGGNALDFLPLGLDWLLVDLLFSALIFIPLEKFRPLIPNMSVFRTDWEEDLLYFAMTHLLVSVIMIVTTSFLPRALSFAVSPRVQTITQSLPWVVQFIAAVFLADLAQYMSHRYYHRSPRFWRVHAVHHSSRTMDWLAASRLHFGEVLITRVAVLVPLYLMGFSQSVLYTYGAIVALHAVFIHANVGFNFGPLRYLIVTPQFHHWHHAADAEGIDKNFAVHFPAIDYLLGTYYQPAGKWPKAYGLAGGEQIPRGIVRQHLYPISGALKS